MSIVLTTLWLISIGINTVVAWYMLQRMIQDKDTLLSELVVKVVIGAFILYVPPISIVCSFVLLVMIAIDYQQSNYSKEV